MQCRTLADSMFKQSVHSAEHWLTACSSTPYTIRTGAAWPRHPCSWHTSPRDWGPLLLSPAARDTPEWLSGRAAKCRLGRRRRTRRTHPMASLLHAAKACPHATHFFVGFRAEGAPALRLRAAWDNRNSSNEEMLMLKVAHSRLGVLS